MTRKYLQEWYDDGNISYSEKVRLNEIGIGNYDYHKLNDLKKILELEEVARRGMNKISSVVISKKIRKIVFFSTWWNSNCAFIIHELKDLEIPSIGKSCIDLLFPSSLVDKISRSVDLFVYEEGNVYLIARFDKWWEKEINSLIRKLNGSNPILATTDKLWWKDDCPGLVKGFKLGYNEYRPSKDIKVFSIIRVERSDYSHVGVYLGKDNYGNHKVAHVTKTGIGFFKAEIANWSELFNSSSHSVSYYYPIIPYKETRLIKKHIAWAVSSKEYRQNYGWILENCQHFVNKCVLGVDFSQETTLIKINENLKKEIENVDRHFNSLTIRSSSELESNWNKIEECLRNSQNDWEDKFEAHIEVVSNCKLQ